MKEIELAITHSIVSNDKWRLLYVSEAHWRKSLRRIARRRLTTRKKSENMKDCSGIFFPFLLLRISPFVDYLNRRRKSREI